MELHFHKYQGAGNDFIVLENRSQTIHLEQVQITKLCDRRFGIGADGLLLLQSHPGYDFEMVYYNSDGKPASMCGNGGRCMAAFAQRIGLVEGQARFLAGDGPHEARISSTGSVELKMGDVNGIARTRDSAILNTGVPHFVRYVDHLDAVNVKEEGRKIRYSREFAAEGINVDFMEYGAGGLYVRTYERGVEDETMACGTGITAAAIAASGNQNQSYTVPVRAKGGFLEVRYDRTGDQEFRNIWLIGPATFVFEGNIQLP